MYTYFECNFDASTEPIVIDFEHLDDASDEVIDLQRKLILLREILETPNQWYDDLKSLRCIVDKTEEQKKVMQFMEQIVNGDNALIQLLLRDTHNYLNRIEDVMLRDTLWLKCINNLSFKQIEATLGINLTEECKQNVMSFLMRD